MQDGDDIQCSDTLPKNALPNISRLVERVKAQGIMYIKYFTYNCSSVMTALHSCNRASVKCTVATPRLDLATTLNLYNDAKPPECRVLSYQKLPLLYQGSDEPRLEASQCSLRRQPFRPKSTRNLVKSWRCTSKFETLPALGIAVGKLWPLP